MSFDLERLAEKLVRFRLQFLVSQAEVAEATGISEAALKKYEAAEGVPSGDEILILADYYRCDFQFFISNERTASFEQTEMLFRRFGEELSKADRWAIQEFLFLCESEYFLLTELGRQPTTKFRFEKKGAHFKTQGQEAAAALRAFLGYKETEASANIFRDLRRADFRVFRRRLENSKISGVFLRHPTAGNCILVNFSEDIFRQLFSAAHEAGHGVLDDGMEALVSFASSKANDLREVRANAFASRFLLPPSLLKALPSPQEWSSDDVVNWAAKLHVNTETLSIALSNARVVDSIAAQRIRNARVPRDAKEDPELPAGLSETGRKRREALLYRGLSAYYANLCFDGLRQGVISNARAATMLLCTEAELGDMASLFGEAL